MASLDNLANEKSSDFEEAQYDPDLEARLYAEIYYSNDNYQPNIPTNDNDSQNCATSLTSTGSIAAASGKDNFVVDTNPSASDKSFEQRNPSKTWISGKSNNTPCGLAHQIATPTRARPQRLLVQKDLWITKSQPQVQRPSAGSPLQNLDDLALATRVSEAETFAAAVRRSKEPRNFSTQCLNRSVSDSNTEAAPNRARGPGKFSSQLRGGAIDRGIILTGSQLPNGNDNFSIQLRSGATVNRSNDTGSFFTQIEGSSIERENILTASNHPNVTDDFAIQLRSGAIVNRCNESEENNREFRGGAIDGNNLSLNSNHNETRNNCLPLSTQNRGPPIEDCNITTVFNNSQISSPQFGRKKADRNSNSIKTRSKTAEFRRKIADRTERFVADSLLSDIDGEGLFSAHLAQQVENFDQLFENQIDNLSDSTEVTNNISPCRNYLSLKTRGARKLARLEKKIEEAARRRERRKKQKQKKRLSQSAKNADVTADGKYKVVSKTNKLKMNEYNTEPVDISSDSDDSILEVPVPPKTPPPVIQLHDSDDEIDTDSGKSNKSSSKRARKTNSDESSTSDSDSSEDDESNIPNSPRITRGMTRKSKNTENSVATSNIQQECEDDSGRTRKSRSKRSKKSAEGNRDESAIPRISETDSPADNTRPTTSRETPRNTKNVENTIASPNIQDSDDSGKSGRSRSKKGKKSADETREESTVSRISETDCSAEPAISKSSSTISQKNARETPKKPRNSESSVSPKNIQECDDDSSGKWVKNRPKKVRKLTEETREEIVTLNNLETSSRDNESSPSTIREAKLQKILEDASKKSKNTEIPATITNPEDGHLILNCTGIQRGASSLEEIRKMREAANLSHVHSDDSMTESEANNWLNIAAGQANSSRKDDEVCSLSSSIDGSINPALWDQLAQENRQATAANSSMEINRPAADLSPIQTTSKSTDGDSHSPATNTEAANSRKRQNATSPFTDFDVPAIPEKRTKSRPKNSREQTMTEYFFKPMSKELKAFYNNPWGGENLDVWDLQSRMPRNPNCWAILDADLQGPISRRRKLCPRCKTEAHYGKRCPEKAKPPCCYMCGATGHTESRCPHSMCLTCGRKYATYRPTCGFCSQLHCTTCNGLGHDSERCPDLWRKYHITTTLTPPVTPKYASNVMKPAQNLCCCNCAKRGHDESMCRQLRWSQHFPTPMYVTSYTEGPTYEPSNRPIPRPLFTDLTNELPREQQPHFDEDQSEVCILDSSHNDSIQESNADISIETIEIPDDSPAEEAGVPSSQARIIFQVGELDPLKTLGWHRSQKRLDAIRNIELTGILSGRVKPEFLLNWEKLFPFGVEIIHDDIAGTFITIVCTTSSIFSEFEKVIWQWLSRTDAEKSYLTYENNPYELSEELRELLRFKLSDIKNNIPVVKLLKKIVSMDQNVKVLAAKRTIDSTPKALRKMAVVLEQTQGSSVRRCQLITALYSGNFVEKGDIIIRRFRSLARERLHRLQSGKLLGIREYLQFVHLNNDLFTFHRTEVLVKALDRAIERFRVEKPVEFETLVKSNVLQFPEAQIPREGSAFLEATTVPTSIPTNPTVDTLAESLPLLAKAGNSVANNDPERTVNDNFDTEISTHEATQNPGGSSTGVLMHTLGKKSRRSYRKLAKTAIKAAIKSNVPRLLKLARLLKTKIDKCTISTDEIEALQREISTDIRGRIHSGVKVKKPKKPRKKRKNTQQPQQNVAAGNDVKSLRNL